MGREVGRERSGWRDLGREEEGEWMEGGGREEAGEGR